MIPLVHRGWTWAWTIALLAYYVTTMCRGVCGLDDDLLFDADVLLALNALSAVAGALILIPACSIAEALVEDHGHTPPHAAKWVAPIAALAATHVALWEPATSFTLNTQATLLGMCATARLVHSVRVHRDNKLNGLLTGTLFGLGLAVQPAIGFAFVIACTPRLLMALKRQEVSTGTGLQIALGAALVSTLAIVFAPMAGIVSPVARSWFTRLPQASLLGANFVDWMVWSLRRGDLMFLMTGFIGYAYFAKQRGIGRFLFWATLGSMLWVTLQQPDYAPDALLNTSYLLPAYWVAALGLGLLCAYAARKDDLWGVVAAGIAIALVVYASPSPWERTRHLDNVIEDLSVERSTEELTDAIRAWSGKLEHGAPGADGHMTKRAMNDGLRLLRAGSPRQAVDMLLATVPTDQLPPEGLFSPIPTRAKPVDVKDPTFRQHVALGSEAQNLYLASLIASAHDADALSRELRRMAAERGLFEAHVPRSPQMLAPLLP